MNDFKPERMKPAGADYLERDELHQLIGEAWNQGLWIKEFGGTPNGGYIAACGSVYLLQAIEYENPDVGEIDPQEFGLGDCIEISVPGGGPTREEAVAEAVRCFNEDDVAQPLREQHEAWATEAEAR